MNWADNHRCTHGLTLNEECEHCEMEGLKESLIWMKRRVLKYEKRLAELEAKYTPDFLLQQRGRNDMTLEDAIEKCAAELPEGASLSVEVEKHSGWVDAENCDGEPWESDTADMTITEQVLAALQWCKDSEPRATKRKAREE